MLNDWIAGAGSRYYNLVWKAVIDADTLTSFRSNADYVEVLEHTTPTQAYEYLKHIDEEAVLEALRRSVAADVVGSPIRHTFGKHLLSPSTLRYAKITNDLNRLFPNLSGYRSIAEIGVGYGGQARFLTDYLGARKSKVETYSMIDLLPVTYLARSYLDNFMLQPRFEYLTRSEIGESRHWDLAISNFAFSEFSKDLQTDYLNRVLRRARSGFLMMNTGLPGFQRWYNDVFTVDELLGSLPNAALVEEDPLSAKGNYVLVYGEHVVKNSVSAETLRSKFTP